MNENNLNCEHYKFNFSEAVVIREKIGNIKIGNVTTLDPESPATVDTHIKNDMYVLDFGIPKGKDGQNGSNTTLTVLPLSTMYGTTVGSWYIYHHTSNDAYDIYGYADVNNEIGQTWEIGERQVWGLSFPLALPSGYHDIFARKNHPNARWDLSFDKGGFYFSTHTITIGANYGYCTIGWYGIGSADNGCLATGSASVHIHIDPSEN